MLYLYPDKGVDLAKCTVAYRSRNVAFDAEKADYVEIAGFEFFATTFRFKDCKHCVVEDCRLRFPTFCRVPAPDAAAFTEVKGDHNTLRRTSLAWSNVGGLAVHGDGNRVEECIVHDVNWHGNYAYAGLQVARGAGDAGNRIVRCSVSCTGNIGILYNGPNNEIAYNHVFDAGKACKDLAAVHTGGGDCRGSESHHNWVHRSSGIGLRGDDQTRGLTVHHNVVWDCGYVGIVVKGDDNAVFHNTLIDGRGGVFMIPTVAEPKKWWTRLPTLPVQNFNSRMFNNAAAAAWWEDKPLPDRSRIVGNVFGETIARRGIGKTYMPAANAVWFADVDALDFRPAPKSPLIGAGIPVAPPAGANESAGQGKTPQNPDAGAYQRNEPYWIPGATWVDAGIGLPAAITDVARRAAAQPKITNETK
jgi:hypothetical protein